MKKSPHALQTTSINESKYKNSNDLTISAKEKNKNSTE
jgi:hypothetical protein